jgi:hypothetical protein
MLDLPSPSPGRRAPKDRHRVVADAGKLSAINRASVDLCIWRRQLSSALSGWLDEVAASHDVALDVRGVRASSFDFEPTLRALPPGPQREAWADDLSQVLRRYAEVIGDEPLRVQLATIDSCKCPRFHVDNVGVRLLCTYAGAGTEWISESSVDREHLRRCDAMHAPTRAGGTVEQLERFDVALMKGSAFEGNGRFGTVHRSPDVSGAPRLVLTVDTLRVPSR